MSIAAETDELLRQIRNVRARRQRNYWQDMEAIDREYDDQLRRVDPSKGLPVLLLIAAAGSAAALLPIVLNVLLDQLGWF